MCTCWSRRQRAGSAGRLEHRQQCERTPRKDDRPAGPGASNLLAPRMGRWGKSDRLLVRVLCLKTERLQRRGWCLGGGRQQGGCLVVRSTLLHGPAVLTLCATSLRRVSQASLRSSFLACRGSPKGEMVLDEHGGRKGARPRGPLESFGAPPPLWRLALTTDPSLRPAISSTSRRLQCKSRSRPVTPFSTSPCFASVVSSLRQVEQV
jgi:hypothetical protein